MGMLPVPKKFWDGVRDMMRISGAHGGTLRPFPCLAGGDRGARLLVQPATIEVDVERRVNL
jgi:hypothetical protein